MSSPGPKLSDLILFSWIASLFVVLAYPLYGLLLRPEKAPEWTQAIAATLAVIAGAAYVRYQHRLEQQARKDEIRGAEKQAVALVVFQQRSISYEVATWQIQLKNCRQSQYRHFELPGHKTMNA